MNIAFDTIELHLQPREVLRVHDPLGARIECIRGGLWITQNRDFEDHFLSANDALTFDRRGLALIHAEQASDLVLIEPVRRATLLARFARWIANTFGPRALDRPRRLPAY
jgi:hypothetical protein